MCDIPKPNAEDSEIGVFGAICHALTNRPIAYFPQIPGVSGIGVKIDDGELIRKIAAVLKELSPSHDELDDVLGHARETLDEVKALTDYQDGKATRLLTIIAFLSALAGVLFGKLADLYPLHVWVARAEVTWWHLALICVAYIGFAIFALLAVCGAMVTFHALRARFRYPKTSRDGRANSFLFFREILGVPPGDWARSYVAPDDRTKLAGDIKLRYFHNYVTESYLIAAKVADKVRYLVPAQSLLASATRTLVLWLLVSGFVFALVPPLDERANVAPTSGGALSMPDPSSAKP